jgi:hypothetical protein
MLGSHAEVLLYATSLSSLNLQMSFSIVVLGLLMVLFSVISFANESSSRSFVYLGMDIAILGLMLIANAGTPRTSSQAYYFDYLIMNACVRIVPLIYAFYMCQRSEGFWNRLFWLLFWINLCNFAICFALNIVASVSFVPTLPIAFTIMLVTFGFHFVSICKKKSIPACVTKH